MNVSDPRSPILVCRYGNKFRFTLNPNSRRQGASGWSAGPASDWCEAPDGAALARAAIKAAAVDATGTRLERQARCHKMGLCTRRGGHWPKEESD